MLVASGQARPEDVRLRSPIGRAEQPPNLPKAACARAITPRAAWQAGTVHVQLPVTSLEVVSADGLAPCVLGSCTGAASQARSSASCSARACRDSCKAILQGGRSGLCPVQPCARVKSLHGPPAAAARALRPQPLSPSTSVPRQHVRACCQGSGLSPTQLPLQLHGLHDKLQTQPGPA